MRRDKDSNPHTKPSNQNVSKTKENQKKKTKKIETEEMANQIETHPIGKNQSLTVLMILAIMLADRNLVLLSS